MRRHERALDGLMTAADAAHILGLSADMVRLLARNGRLRAAVTSVRGVRLFRRSDVEALAAERKGQRAHNHVVQFYNDEDALSAVVADFLRDGLISGAPAVVIATEGHCTSFCDRLVAQGVDVPEKIASEQLILLNAHETLRRFCVDGRPDAEKFREHVGGLIARRVEGARGRLRAYGEMVDLLWKEGGPDAARHLESLWNDLAEAYPFSLLCTYAMTNFKSAEDSRPFQQVCDLHTRVVPVDTRPGEVDLGHRGREIALLQQRAQALDGEIERRKKTEAELRALKAELQRQSAGRAREGSSS